MRPNVKYIERDLSAYVSENSTIGVGYIVPANKGKRGKVLKFSTPDLLLKELTPNGKIEVGESNALFSALRISQKSGNLYVVVPKAKGVKFASVGLNSSKQPDTIADPVEDPSGHNHNSSVLITASSEGTWGNDLRVRVANYKTTQKVKTSNSHDLEDNKKTFGFDLDKIKEDDPDNVVWGAGYPVTVYGPDLAEELDANTTYFIGKTLGEGKGAYALYSTQKDAISGTNPIKFSKLTTESTLISPAIQYTRIPNTSCLMVYKSSDLNNPIGQYIVSLDKSAMDANNNTLFIEEVLRGTEFIEADLNELVSSSHQLFESFEFTALTGGNNGMSITTGDMIKATRLFDNAKEVKITLIGDGGYSVPAFHDRLRSLCQSRGDCVPILSAPLTTQKNASTSAMDIVNWRKFIQNIDSSWAALYAPHIKTYDEFNDREIWLAPDCFVIEQILKTGANYELWYPVAGNKRGMLEALDTKVHFTDGDQDLLYDNGINPIVFDSGIRIWGQKTLQSQPSMLDRLNVRMLLITIGPAITQLLHDFLFEFNDAPTRASARLRVESYLDSILARRGIKSFKVICDETNNTPNDIDNHIMRLWVIICPNNSIEEIVFPLAVTNNSTKLENVYKLI